jgi:hypothetical protein
MNTRPTFDPSLVKPTMSGPFTRRQRYHDLQRAKYNPAVVPLPAMFDAKTLVIPTAVAAIRKAFTLAKTSRDAWQTAKREGRIDFRQAPRASRGAQDIFKRKTGQSTTRVKVSVLIDASGSMHGRNTGSIQHPYDPAQKVQTTAAMAAAVFGATIAEAIGRVPTVNLDVFQHSAGHGQLFLKWRWSKGTPAGVFNEALYSIGGGGNADGHALYAVTERMRKGLRRGERGIILMVSDGLPSIYASGGAGNAGSALTDAVAYARKAGFEVIAVAIDGSDQSAYYGEKGVIRFDGNWNTLGSALARHIGAAMASR